MDHLEAGDSLKLSATESRKFHPEIQLTSPRNGDTALAGNRARKSCFPESRIEHPRGRYKLRIRSGGANGPILVEKDLAATSAEVEVPGSEAIVWDVKGMYEQDGAEGFFQTALKTPPQIIFPPDGFQVPFHDAGKPVHFSWEKRAGADGYLLQVTETPDFKPTLTDSRTHGGDFLSFRPGRPLRKSFGAFASNRRIHSQDSAPRPAACLYKPPEKTSPEPRANSRSRFPTPGNRFRLPSAFKSASLRYSVHHAPEPEKSEPPLEAPKLRNGKMTLSWAETGALKQDLNLSWSPSEGAKSYRVQISAAPDFHSTLVNSEVHSTKFVWKDPVPGTLYARKSPPARVQRKP